MKDIDQFLRENAPETPDEGQFLIETNARLDSVEGIKETVDGENHRWRVALIITLAAGLALGCAVTLLAVFYPLPQADSSAFAQIMEALKAHRDILMGFIACCAIALGLVLLTRTREAL